MEASALQHSARAPALVGRSPLLRLQSDERLIALIRRGHHGAFEALVNRYESRLLSFCRHMLGSTEDAEDVLQEVFASSFNAICADERPINARPWLYRIARNRCLNHLRRPVSSGQDSMDVFERDGGTTTADTVHKREEFRHIVADVQDLPETQRTALLLREIDALSYDQISEAMDTTVPSVKSLLVRARVSLAEAAEARLLTCEEVRLELGQVAEGLVSSSAPARRHLKGCDRCRTFKSELRRTNKALAAVYPIGPLVILKKMLAAKIGTSAVGGGSAGVAGGSASSAGMAGAAAAGGSTVAGGGAVATAGSSITGLLSAGTGAIASKAAAGVVAAAIVTAGAVEVRQVTTTPERSADGGAQVADARSESLRAEHAAVAAAAEAELAEKPAVADEDKSDAAAADDSEKTDDKKTAADGEDPSATDEGETPTDAAAPTSPAHPSTPAAPGRPASASPTAPGAGAVQQDGGTVALPAPSQSEQALTPSQVEAPAPPEPAASSTSTPEASSGDGDGAAEQ